MIQFFSRSFLIFCAALAIASCSKSAPRAAAPTGQAKAPATQPAQVSARPAPATGPSNVLKQPQSEKEYLAQASLLREIYSKPAAEWPKPILDPGIPHREIGKLPPPEFPKDNPWSKDKEDLGKMLFFDPRLSGSGQIACASCHDPDLAWADGRTVSFGHGRTALKRNAPSILFSAYLKPLFWDGRAATLEDQFHAPVESPEEMNAKAEEVESRLNSVPEYRKHFKDAFDADRITMADASKAVATFERSLARMAGVSKFDKFMGGDTNALSDAAVRGLHLFRTSARCMNCHNGPLFTDGDFHDLGLSYYGRKFHDLGRYEITKDPKDVGRFKTPTLRDADRTGPLMHLGIFNLEGTINAYNMGMATLTPTTAQKSDPLFPKKDPLLKRLGLGKTEKADLIEFVRSLNERVIRIRPPQIPGIAKGAQAAGQRTQPVQSE
jgi:cytochrome c peroxidase